jgi:hypothetical protein
MRMSRSLLGAILALFLARPATPQTLYLHSGAVNPVSEGWQADVSTPRFVGFGMDDGGIPAWVVRDSIGTPSAYRTYQVDPTAHANAIEVNGWTFRCLLRIPVVNTNLNGVVSFFFKSDSGKGYAFVFGTRANGDPYVGLTPDPLLGAVPRPEFTIPGGAGLYHLYDFVYHPQTQRVDVLVDGVLISAQYAGWLSAQRPQVFFGIFSSGPTEARFARVEFLAGTDLPVPAGGTTWGAVKASYRGD